MENSTTADVTILDEPTAVSIILRIEQLGMARASDLRSIAGGYDRMKNLMRKMEAISLITIQIEEKPRLTYIYQLTEKGKKVAKKLEEIDSIIQG